MTAPIPFADSQLDQTRHVSAFFNRAAEEYRVLLPWAAGNIWCLDQVSKTLKTAPGLVVIFVKSQRGGNLTSLVNSAFGTPYGFLAMRNHEF
jgi:hypothetical protein